MTTTTGIPWRIYADQAYQAMEKQGISLKYALKPLTQANRARASLSPEMRSQVSPAFERIDRFTSAISRWMPGATRRLDTANAANNKAVLEHLSQAGVSPPRAMGMIGQAYKRAVRGSGWKSQAAPESPAWLQDLLQSGRLGWLPRVSRVPASRGASYSPSAHTIQLPREWSTGRQLGAGLHEASHGLDNTRLLQRAAAVPWQPPASGGQAIPSFDGRGLNQRVSKLFGWSDEPYLLNSEVQVVRRGMELMRRARQTRQGQQISPELWEKIRDKTRSSLSNDYQRYLMHAFKDRMGGPQPRQLPSWMSAALAEQRLSREELLRRQLSSTGFTHWLRSKFR